MRVERPRSFVIPSSREAVSTVSPWTAYSSRRAEPSRADVAGYERPAVEADPHPEAIAEAAIAQPAVEARQAHVEHLPRRRDGAVGVVGERDRGPKTASTPSPR
jgi:hypothetical protein